MDSTNESTFSQMLIGQGELYDKPVTNAMIDIYFNALKNYDIQDIINAFNAHVADPDQGRFFPKPAHLIRIMSGDADTRALAAWSKVIDGIRRFGHYQTVVFDDPIIHAVLFDMGGWIKICGIDNDEEPFKRNEFEKRYRGYTLNPPKAYPKQLTGFFQQENERNGHDAKVEYGVIGNERQARMVYKGGSSEIVKTKRLDTMLEDIKTNIAKLPQDKVLKLEKRGSQNKTTGVK